MEAVFRAMLNTALHGEYRITGSTILAVDTGTGARRRQGVELHESVHAELTDVSTYGWFQQLLARVAGHDDPDLRRAAREALDVSMAATARTHEGLATLRELAWVAANEGSHAAETYVAGLPEFYSYGLELALRLFRDPLLGDPRDEPYLGFGPVAFHVAVIALGLVAMNSPILVHHAGAEVLLREDLHWIATNGPDDRLLTLVEHPEALRDMLFGVLTSASRIRDKGLLDAEVRHAVYDSALEHVRKAISGFPVVLTQEHAAQSKALKERWIPLLNQRSRKVHFAAGVTGRHEIGPDRALDMAYERPNAGPHESKDADALDLGAEAFVEAHQKESISGMFRMVMIATDPPDIPPELVVESGVGLLSVPLWGASASEASPLVRFQPMLVSSMPMRDFLSWSSELSQAGCIWYSSLSLIRAIRRQALDLRGFVVQKCDSPRLLLGVSEQPETEQPHYATFRFGDDNILTIISKDTFSFSLASAYQMEVFLNEVVTRGVRRLDSSRVATGPTSLPTDVVARGALWGFVGR